MLKLRYSDLLLYSLVTFAFVKVFNIIYTLIAEGMDAIIYYDLVQFSMSVFIYITIPLFNIKVFDKIPYRILQVLHLTLCVGFIIVFTSVSGMFLALNKTSLQSNIQSGIVLYVIMNIIIEVAERMRVRYYVRLMKNNRD